MLLRGAEQMRKLLESTDRMREQAMKIAAEASAAVERLTNENQELRGHLGALLAALEGHNG